MLWQFQIRLRVLVRAIWHDRSLRMPLVSAGELPESAVDREGAWDYPKIGGFTSRPTFASGLVALNHGRDEEPSLLERSAGI